MINEESELETIQLSVKGLSTKTAGMVQFLNLRILPLSSGDSLGCKYYCPFSTIRHPMRENGTNAGHKARHGMASFLGDKVHQNLQKEQ